MSTQRYVIPTLRRLTLPSTPRCDDTAEEFADRTALVMDNAYWVIHHGKLLGADGRVLDPSTFTEPKAVFTALGVVEDNVVNECLAVHGLGVMNTSTVLDHVKPFAGNKRGHLYLTKPDYSRHSRLVLYLWHGQILDPCTLNTVSGHLYVTPALTHALVRRFTLMVNDQITLEDDFLPSCMRQDNQGALQVTGMSMSTQRYANVCTDADAVVETSSRPRKFVADLGHVVSKVTGLWCTNCVLDGHDYLRLQVNQDETAEQKLLPVYLDR